jgi:hypothetical protein
MSAPQTLAERHMAALQAEEPIWCDPEPDYVFEGAGRAMAWFAFTLVVSVICAQIIIHLSRVAA